VFAGERAALAKLLARRPAVLTPHAAEFARLASTTVPGVLESRFEIGRELAAQLGATVLLKGTPTVIFDADGEHRLVSASGTPVLATGGSGDVLSGITGTLLAQSLAPFIAAACGAWVHGRASELVQFAAGDARRDARGLVLDDVVQALRDAWRVSSALPPAPVLAELPAVEGRA
jgi:NAD(P)H-hydrate epimerase